ncbi:TRAP-type C4-dicarboxylate transport system permease small subunit [Aliiruegeria haliotis]|uniref:TRAP transporter small permease protein n=1 Tax=Aliiruegeria haliotis TaxID=1280846 RepID=A0A2T0RIF2_9RHOB|nr:TRAP transporter small permease [Aliiruegeria haliotis]PRY20984.1 TRAP-type C4-dicarboxylate transport system permease small subunit [Aliiruegeria haliotis]
MSDPNIPKDSVTPTEPVEPSDEAIPEAGLLGRVINSFGILFALGILASAFILMIEVVMRYGFNAPTFWAHETVIFINACAFVFGGLYVVARNGHIRVVLIYNHLSGGLRRAFDVGISITCLVATIFFGWAAWAVLVRAVWTPTGELRLETSGSAWNPPTPGMLKIFLFVILVMMAVQFAVLTVNYFRKPGR